MEKYHFSIRIMLALIILALITGCQTLGEAFKVDNRVSSTVVHWMTTDDVEGTCNRSMAIVDQQHRYLHFVQGCAIFMIDHSSCVIITGKNTTESILGHELRHCFEGQFHR